MPETTYHAVTEWRRFQHYKGRNPPWLKVHRELLDSKRWRQLSAEAGRLLVDVWMLAAETSGVVDSTTLAWRLRMTEQDLDVPIQELQLADFITTHQDHASALQATSYHDAMPDQSRGRGEKEQRRSE